MPYNIQFTLLIALFLYSTSVFSQRAAAESATSVYFAIPAFDIETANPDNFSFSFAMGNTSFKTPTSFEAENVCVAAGSKNVIKDAKKIKVFQYSVPAEIQDAFLVIEKPGGEVLYAEKIGSSTNTSSLFNETIELIYGDGECYWHPQILEDAWKEDQETWKQKHHEQIKTRVFENANRSAQTKFKFGYAPYSVNVYTGKGGNGHDYSELNEAQKQAIAAYNKISNEGMVNQQTIHQLMIPVSTWLRHIEQINLEDKRAKINGRVARGLYMNLATAYFQLHDIENALKYLGLHEGTDQGVINLSKLITDQQRGMAANPNLSNDFAVLNEKARSIGQFTIRLKDLGEHMVDDLESRHYFYSKDAKKETAITAAGGSIYKSNITQGQYGPTLIMMSVFDGDLNEFPVEVTQLDVKGLVFTGGYSFTSIPPDIGDMTNLREINLSASAVSSIPDEIGKLTNLKKLNLSGTQVSTLPESIKNLQNLAVLNIKKTKISAAELAKIKSWLPSRCKVRL